MNLSACPPEIHSYICQLACIDDGTTVLALGLVSKYFREVSKMFLYQSITIRGLENISILAARLDSIPAHLRQIKHLFIADRIPVPTITSPKPTQAPTRPLNLSTACDSASISRILTLAAPTVETLTFVATSPASSTTSIARLFRLHFPRLSELSVSGFYPFPSARTMPALTRLHLHGNRNPYGLLQADGLATACPELTHLRVSGLSMAGSFVAELREALAGGVHEGAIFPSALSEHVQEVLVQPAQALSKVGKPAAAHARDEAMMQLLGEVRPRKGVRFEVLERLGGESVCEIFRKNWIERLEGERGCWLV